MFYDPIVIGNTVQQIDFENSVFTVKSISIPPEAQIIFVSDMFVEDYVGGAELTSEALISASPFQVFKLRSKDVTIALLESGMNKFWIFGNFAELNPQLIPSIIANLQYSIVEYDYKYCKTRSPEKHLELLKVPCDCPNQMVGKLISAFFYGSMGLWWMSEKQKERYLMTFPFLAEKDNVVLSSVFDPRTLAKITALNNTPPEHRKGWIVLGSNSWVKGADDAERWCKDTGKDYEVVWNLPYELLLEKLSRSEGFVYLPKGGDTCPRMVIEAKLLGCELHINDNVQHKDEVWFNTDDLDSIKNYLYASPVMFWKGIKEMMDYKPSISGYLTTYNCVKQDYPFEQSIASMLAFCNEVCVVDGGSTDDTWSKLQALATQDSRLKITQIHRDWNSPRFSVFDGMQKAEARKMCTSDFCWQMDSDEVVHEQDCDKIIELCKSMPKNVDIVCLPVIEYWGGPEKVRVDIQPWKWRLSRNLPHITHGIPMQLRRLDKHGELCSAPGTDGCDMIHAQTGEILQHVNFYTSEVESVRLRALSGDTQALQEYENWFNQVANGIPGVFHYSWYNLPRKIRLYRDYWSRHWNNLWAHDESDTSENNMMFDSPWSLVTEEMIEQRAQEMKNKLGGWIWHRKWDGVTTTPHVCCNRPQPKVMQ